MSSSIIEVGLKLRILRSSPDMFSSLSSVFRPASCNEYILNESSLEVCGIKRSSLKKLTV